MSRSADSLPALRDRALQGVDALVELLGVGRSLGLVVPDDEQIRAPLRRIGDFDVNGLSADSHRLAAVHRAVSDQLHRLPEQQVRLDDGWSSASGAAAVGIIIEHQRRAESDLDVLRTLSEATGAAASGIDRILRTWYLAVARCSAPVVAGVPVAELPGAILVGKVTLPVVAADIGSRVTLLQSTAEITLRSVDLILDTLNRATEGLAATDAHAPRTPPPAPRADIIDHAPVATVAPADPGTGSTDSGSTDSGSTDSDVPLTLPGTDVAPQVSDAAPPDRESADRAPADQAPADQEPEPPVEPTSIDSGPRGAVDPVPHPDGDLALAGDQ
ncbi:hypothetical protein ACWDTD_05990 [Gordonia sp. NPDC003425]